ncbi:phospholipase effector Tle1 domain-containing protein [Colwellia sp. MEBiC06753]
MALLIFNFDGTGNEPEDANQQIKKGKKEDDNISNVLKFHFLSGGNLHADQQRGSSSHSSVKHCFYYQGIGTYGNWLQRLLNQGLSLEHRDVASILNKAYQDFNDVYQAGDLLIVTGFSRGAALARRFAAKIIEKSDLIDDNTAPFIYLAVFDTVASIGLPNLNKSERPDYDVVFENGCTLSHIIKQATHMVSLDDKRKAFQPTLMNYDRQRIIELWFSGAHSDVGGGYYRDGLSDVALSYLINWIAYQVKQHGLIDPALKLPSQQALATALPAKLKNQLGLDDLKREANELGKNHQQDRWPVIDWLTLDDRLCCVIDNDKVSKQHKPVLHNAIPNRIAFDKDYRPKSLTNVSHHVWYGFNQSNEAGFGVKRYVKNPRPHWHALEPEESITISIDSTKIFNHSSILVEVGEVYQISAAEHDTWTDGSITCNASGWNTDEVSLGWKEIPIKLARRMKRVKDADWFTLCASVGRTDKLAKKVGCLAHYKVTEDGELTLFANDVKSAMANNIGYIDVTIKRTQ